MTELKDVSIQNNAIGNKNGEVGLPKNAKDFLTFLLPPVFMATGGLLTVFGAPPIDKGSSAPLKENFLEAFQHPTPMFLVGLVFLALGAISLGVVLLHRQEKQNRLAPVETTGTEVESTPNPSST